MAYQINRGTQAEFPDKGKPAARPGRKATGLPREIAGLPKENLFTTRRRAVPPPANGPTIRSLLRYVA